MITVLLFEIQLERHGLFGYSMQKLWYIIMLSYYGHKITLTIQAINDFRKLLLHFVNNSKLSGSS